MERSLSHRRNQPNRRNPRLIQGVSSSQDYLFRTLITYF